MLTNDTLRFFLIASLALPTFGTHLKAQVPTLPILKRTLEVVALVERQGHQVLFFQVDNIDRNSISSQTYHLHIGKKYGIVAIGDEERISDIDLEVFSPYGTSVGKDGDDKNIATVFCYPAFSGQYKMHVNGYHFNSGYQDGFFALVIFEMR